MTKVSRFKEEYIDKILATALINGKRITNVQAAKEIGVSEWTIRAWRKEHHEFDKVFVEAANFYRKIVNESHIYAVRMRKRKITTSGPNGKTETIEDIPPNQIASVASSIIKSGLGYAVNPDSGKDDILRKTIKRKLDGELTALEAAQLLESEGIGVPKTLMLEVQKEIGGISGEEVMTMATNLGQLMDEANRRVQEHAVNKKE